MTATPTAVGGRRLAPAYPDNMAGAIGSWLSGPEPIPPDSPDRELNDYPGRRFGLAEKGPRSAARTGRRLAALSVDWLIAYGLAALGMAIGLIPQQVLSTAVLVVWFILGAVSVRLFGFSPGQLALGLIVVPADDRDRIGLGRAAMRGLLITLVIPPLIADTDLRGLQDRLTNTMVIRR